MRRFGRFNRQITHAVEMDRLGQKVGFVCATEERKREAMRLCTERNPDNKIQFFGPDDMRKPQLNFIDFDSIPIDWIE